MLWGVHSLWLTSSLLFLCILSLSFKVRSVKSQPGQWLACSEKEKCQRNICEILLSSSSRQLRLISHCIQCSEVTLTLFQHVPPDSAPAFLCGKETWSSHAHIRQGSGINWLQCYGALLGSYLRAVCTYSNFPFLNTAKKNDKLFVHVS